MTRTSRGRSAAWARRAAIAAVAAVLLTGITVGTAVAAPPVQTQQDQDAQDAQTQDAQDSAAQDSAAQDSAAQARAAQEQDAQEQADQAAEQQREAAAAAAAAQVRERAIRAQQQAAQAAARGRASWESHGRPSKMLIVRPSTVDSLTDGAVTQRTPRAPGAVTITGLDRAAPSGWITVTNGVAQLSAAVVLSPGVTLDVGGDVATLQLLGGPTAPAAASIYTGSGRLAVHGVTVTSLDPATGKAVGAGPGRPFVHVSAGGRMDATDATFADLGTPATDPQDHAGVTFSTGATGSLVRTTVARSSTGVRLNGATGVRLEGLTVADSASDGLILQGDRGTTLISVRAERNGENGVQVSGPSSDRPITGIATAGNRQFGVAVISQKAPQITNITTQGDLAGGLQLAGDDTPVVTNFTAVDQPIGILTHVSSSRVTLTGLRISGGGRGVAVEKTSDGLTLSGSTIERAQTAVSVGAHRVELHDVLLGESQSGLRVERGAGDVTATNLSVNGGQNGIVLVRGTNNVVVRDSVIDGQTNAGIRTSSPGAQILGGRISNSPTGIDAEAATTINGTEISGANVGIRARATDLVVADDVDVSAMTSGINVAQGSPFVLTNSRVDALQAVSGEARYQGLNTLSLPPLNVLGVIGLPLVLLALLLDQVQRFRQRRRGGELRHVPPTLPAH